MQSKVTKKPSYNEGLLKALREEVITL